MKNKQLVLVIEDDNAIRNLILTTLEMNNYAFLCAGSGELGIMETASHNPDVVLLDLGLPDKDGVEVIRKIRTWSQVPIIVLSARSEDKDKIEALDAGADDYLTKPFSVDELLARLRVTFRRLNHEKPEENTIFKNGALEINFSAGCASVDGEELRLTPIEYKLLCVLAKNIGKVLTHHFIKKEVWGASSTEDFSSLRVFMATLRKKIEKVEKAEDSQNLIQTHVGIGYRMIKIDE